VTSPRVDHLDTGVCVVLLEPTAERTFVTTWGAERHVSVGSLDTSSPQPGDLVCVSGYSLVEPTLTPLLAWLEGLRTGAEGQGVEVVLDPGAIFAELPAEVVSRVLAVTTVWTSNMDEAAALVKVDEMGRAAGLVAEQLPRGRVVVVRDGDRGCAVWDDSGTAIVPGFPQKAVDTNGAGDTHTGAMIAAVTRGLSWPEAAGYANAAAGLKVTGKGLGSIPHRDAVEDFLRSAP
jgi:sugar/nucleoside kinase (ribokinase family)